MIEAAGTFQSEAHRKCPPISVSPLETPRLPIRPRAREGDIFLGYPLNYRAGRAAIRNQVCLPPLRVRRIPGEKRMRGTSPSGRARAWWMSNAPGHVNQGSGNAAGIPLKALSERGCSFVLGGRENWRPASYGGTEKAPQPAECRSPFAGRGRPPPRCLTLMHVPQTASAGQSCVATLIRPITTAVLAC